MIIVKGYYNPLWYLTPLSLLLSWLVLLFYCWCISTQTSSGSRSSLWPLLLIIIPLLINIFSCSLFFVSNVLILVSCFTEIKTYVSLNNTHQDVQHNLPIIAFNFLISELSSSILFCDLSEDSATSLLHSSRTIDWKFHLILFIISSHSNWCMINYV